MSSSGYDVVVIGAGIIGLASALCISRCFPKLKIAVLEKEEQIASHQTGHNSGVIHSGIYYRPNSSKSQFCIRGVKALKMYCLERGITYDECGKVIVATDASQLQPLENLYSRGIANGVPNLQMIGPERLKEIEPYSAGIKAIHAPHTAIVDFQKVALSYAKDFQINDGEILVGNRVVNIVQSFDGVMLETSAGTILAKKIVNCAGLYADKIAHMMGFASNLRILPFRGEYYILNPARRYLVKGLIYPVPDPRFPFLGVHYTKRIDGEIEAGPNAVLAWAREGYEKTMVSPIDLAEILTFPGFWRMAWHNWEVGLSEIHRSMIKKVFVSDLQDLLPDIRSNDVTRGGSGVRAQAVDRSGRLLDDFHIEQSENAIHVLNAPSPAATSSLAIGSYIAELTRSSFNIA